MACACSVLGHDQVKDLTKQNLFIRFDISVPHGQIAPDGGGGSESYFTRARGSGRTGPSP